VGYCQILAWSPGGGGSPRPLQQEGETPPHILIASVPHLCSGYLRFSSCYFFTNWKPCLIVWTIQDICNCLKSNVKWINWVHTKLCTAILNVLMYMQNGELRSVLFFSRWGCQGCWSDCLRCWVRSSVYRDLYQEYW